MSQDRTAVDMPMSLQQGAGMRYPIAIPLLLALLPAAVFAGSRDAECQNWTQQAIERPSVGCEAACPQARVCSQ